MINDNIKPEELEYRMYGMVAYQLSGTVHAGIQFGHAVVEYVQEHFNDLTYQSWATKDKTFIILSGGSTNDTLGKFYGGLQDVRDKLKDKIFIAEFREPDLNNSLSAIAFLVDERVFKRRPYFDDDNYYPDFDVYLNEKGYLNTERPMKELIYQFPENYKEWTELIGGQANVFLRDYLPKFKLA